jgi:hypothetical protein
MVIESGGPVEVNPVGPVATLELIQTGHNTFTPVVTFVPEWDPLRPDDNPLVHRLLMTLAHFIPKVIDRMNAVQGPEDGPVPPSIGESNESPN